MQFLLAGIHERTCSCDVLERSIELVSRVFGVNSF